MPTHFCSDMLPSVYDGQIKHSAYSFTPTHIKFVGMYIDLNILYTFGAINITEGRQKYINTFYFTNRDIGYV